LDDGRLTDGQGRTINFKNTVIAMTSNIGSSEIQKFATREAPEWEVEAAVKELLKDHFRPEFLNRIDEVILFHSLDKTQLTKIVDVQLESLRKRLALRNLKMSISDDARKLLADEGYDPTYGARPLKRVIQQKIENPLASKILNGEFTDGATIAVDATASGSFTFALEGEKAAKADARRH
jgi:ATP-dependent Clp protease ATP-binding subunit ClpB